MSAALERYFQLWRLEPDGAPFETHTSTLQFVCRDSAPCVLKIGRAESDEATAAALLHFGGNGAVKLLEADGLATLTARAVPGTPLSDLVAAGSDDEATRVICNIMTALHSAPPTASTFPTIEDWGAAFERPAASALPAQLVEGASATYAELCRSQARRVLLHGDLHHDNILFDVERGWLAIDPKGAIGEAEFESSALLRNPTDDPQNFAQPEIIARRTTIMCEMQGWSRDRVLRWCFAQGVLSAIWSVEDGDDPIRGLSTAAAVRRLI